jgi:hypothetical protein
MGHRPSLGLLDRRINRGPALARSPERNTGGRRARESAGVMRNYVTPLLAAAATAGAAGPSAA